jgi:hypothetical protein
MIIGRLFLPSDVRAATSQSSECCRNVSATSKDIKATRPTIAEFFAEAFKQTIRHDSGAGAKPKKKGPVYEGVMNSLYAVLERRR